MIKIIEVGNDKIIGDIEEQVLTFKVSKAYKVTGSASPYTFTAYTTYVKGDDVEFIKNNVNAIYTPLDAIKSEYEAL